MLNRELLIVRLKQPFADWINAADPNPDSAHVTLEDANEDCAVFLIHEYACEDLEGWLAQCYLSNMGMALCANYELAIPILMIRKIVDLLRNCKQSDPFCDSCFRLKKDTYCYPVFCAL